MKLPLYAVPLIAAGIAGATAAPLELQIVQRPPYLMVRPDHSMDGIAVRPTAAAFKKAGIDVVWREVPALRQLQRLQANQERVCSVGWYKTAARQRYAKFTQPVSQDSPWAGFASSDFTPVANATVRGLLATPKLSVLIKTGFVYGDFLDRELASMKAQRMDTMADMTQLLLMIEAGRAQLTFAPIEEIQYYLSHYSSGADATSIITFAEMPAGYHRHLMCSKRVEDELIARFNAALAPLKEETAARKLKRRR